jgi:hypothetical protein
VAKDHRSSAKDDKQHEGLRERGMRKSRAARIANHPGASSKGCKGFGLGQAPQRRQPGRHEGPEARGRKQHQLSVLPRGPSGGPLAQTVALHRDPLGVRRRGRARHGDVFTLRLATVRPIVVVARSSEVEPLPTADRDAGEARRRVIAAASPRSIRPRAFPRVDPLLEPVARSDSRRRP